MSRTLHQLFESASLSAMTWAMITINITDLAGTALCNKPQTGGGVVAVHKMGLLASTQMSIGRKGRQPGIFYRTANRKVIQTLKLIAP